MLNRYDGRSTDWIIDNNDRPLLNIRPIWQYYMDEVKSMYIVPDDPRATDNRVAIYIYLHTFFSSESNKGLRRTYFQGFNQASTFRTEDYSVIPPMADFRRTKVEFFNNSTCEEMYISVEGMTQDGKVLVNE